MLTLEPDDAGRLSYLCGQFDSNLRQIERHLGVEIRNRGNQFQLRGKPQAVATASSILHRLYAGAGPSQHLAPEKLHLELQNLRDEAQVEKEQVPWPVLRTKNAEIKPRSHNQRTYVEAIRSSDLCFGIGPAGTGKTYLAVACAVESLEEGRVERIILTRPAVEAGERLGFLPGDLSQKVNPYLHPLYDALHEMLGGQRLNKLMQKNLIEVEPLAYMRGRTLGKAFVILDEAQNTMPAQIKMFLTRLGFGSKAAVNGDPSQADLPDRQRSGLSVALERLQGIEGIHFIHFDKSDVVRHALVRRIVAAWEQQESSDSP